MFSILEYLQDANELDLDLLSGQIVSAGPGGRREAWGGLAIAYLHPDQRVGDLVTRTTGAVTVAELHKATA